MIELSGEVIGVNQGLSVVSDWPTEGVLNSMTIETSKSVLR